MRGRDREVRALSLTAVFCAAALVACGNPVTTPHPGDSGAGPDPVPPPVDLSRAWTKSTPGAEGFDPELLESAFANAANAVPNIRALVAVRNGHLVEEAYYGGMHRDSAFDMRSVTKTVTALLVGLASDRGLLDPEDPMTDWLSHPSRRSEHGGIRVRDLLTMTSGMQWSDEEDFGPWARSGRPVGYVLDLPIVAPPGRRFIYNTGGSHLLTVIVENAVDGSALEFAERELMGPLGIDNKRWPVMQDSVIVGGAALALRARDAAKIGQLLLQGGRSGSRQVVSRAWTATQVDRLVALGDIGYVLRDAGYGYQTWSDRQGGGEDVSAFVMWGYGGQFVWVVPDRQLVVVAQTHWRGTGDHDGRQADAVADLIVHRVIEAARPIRG
ncbi:MAG: serine hydrolase [Gemmatimonadota bacterium]|uniref:serine hydrolase domain-containing protein n=1 Tax=Candidatus Palauibacter scopulicola TaxID=3056741 RepID=UPI00238B3AD5|nr:serine hydrolase [Candidatus Palauibacter scopulicola]MDE2664236.1 serine hydrolase [Candidatus Palauibacter scopulicola]